MLEFYRKVFGLLTPHERRQFLLLMGLMIAVAAAELVGMSAVLVLLSVLADPERALAQPAIGWVHARLGLDSMAVFQLVLSAGVIGMVLIGLAVKALGNYAAIRFAERRGYGIATRLLRAYLNRPYVWFLSRNTAEISRSVLSDSGEFVAGALIPALRVLAGGLMALAIVGFLVAIDPVIALATGALIGGGYAVIYLRLRRRLQRLGQEIFEANTARFRTAQEATGGFKELKLLGLEDSYARRFEAAAARRADRASLSAILSEMPRYALEGLSFAVLVGVLLLMLLRNDGNLAAAIPTLGVYAFATMRLLPALQQLYYAFARMRTAQTVLNRLSAEAAATAAEAVSRPLPVPATTRLPLAREIVLDHVSFAYPAAERQALHDVSLRIAAHSTVGIVGGTGAGKTTLVDLILGLLTPDRGGIRIDDTPLDRNSLRAWQNSLGYVPQTIYLTDNSVAANIAFGVPPERIDMAAVERAARIAALHDFVAGELPQGYDTLVGERGVRLSGGQRQRIGIARALYHDPDLLVFDEATSALDTITEQVVMEAVQAIRRDKTIVLIAHRLGTVRNCDVIHLMEHGRIAASGSFDALVSGSETFRRMASGS